MYRLPLLVVLLAVSLSACELFGDPNEALLIDVPVSIELPQALPIVYPSASQIAALPVTSDGRRVFELPPVYVNDLNVIALDPSVAEVADRIEGIQIAGVDVAISANSLDVPIEPIELRVGAQGDTWAQAFPTAVTSTLPIGFEGDSQADLVAQNRDQVTEYLGTFRFGIGLGTQFVIPEGAPPAGGRANARFTIRLILQVSPL